MVTREGSFIPFQPYDTLFPVALLLYLFLRLISKLIKLTLALATISWSFWIDIGILVTSTIAALSTGGILLRRKWRERHLKLEFFITKNPARVNDAIEEKEVLEGPLRPGNLELIYFKIRNKSKLVLPDKRIYVEFPRGFTVLDEDEVNGLPTGTPLGTLQKDCVPLLHPEEPPTFKNLIWGKRKQPTLLMRHLVFYDPSYGNSTTILREGDLFIPVWVRTPEKTGRCSVSLKVEPWDIDKHLEGKLTLELLRSEI